MSRHFALGSVRAASIVLLFACSLAAHAGAPPDITKEERALLPRWCNAVQGWLDSPAAVAEYERLKVQYGPGWEHMHHYCWTLIDVIRLDQRSIRKPPTYASAARAIGGIDYVLRNTHPSFPFRPEMMARRARLLARYQGPVPAKRAAEALIIEWPQVSDGYIILADLLLKANQREEAMKVLSIGRERVADQQRFAQQQSILGVR